MKVSYLSVCILSLTIGSAMAQTTVTTTGGTSNTVPKFSGSSSIANSAISETGGNVGIGTSSPQAILHVAGNPGTEPGLRIETQDAILFGTFVCCGATGVTGSSLASSAGWSSSYNGLFLNSNGTSNGSGGAQSNNTLPSWRLALGSGGLEWPGGDNFVIARVPPGGSYNAPSILFSTNNAGKIKVAGGVDATGGGVKHVRAGGCSASGTASCSVTVSWPGSAFSDTNYTAVCTPDSAGQGVFSITSKSTTSVTVTISPITITTGLNNGSSFNVNMSGVECMAMHD